MIHKGDCRASGAAYYQSDLLVEKRDSGKPTMLVNAITEEKSFYVVLADDRVVSMEDFLQKYIFDGRVNSFVMLTSATSRYASVGSIEVNGSLRKTLALFAKENEHGDLGKAARAAASILNTRAKQAVKIPSPHQINARIKAHEARVAVVIQAACERALKHVVTHLMDAQMTGWPIVYQVPDEPYDREHSPHVRAYLKSELDCAGYVTDFIETNKRSEGAIIVSLIPATGAGNENDS